MLISNYAIKFRVAVLVFILVIAVFGVYSYISLPREGPPDITIPYVTVTAVYQGTAPSEMEKLVTIPIEKRIKDVEGLKEIRSTTAEGVAVISAEFTAGEDIDNARQQVKNKVDLARPDLPSDLDEPVVDAFNFSTDRPIFIFAVSGSHDLERLRNIAEDMQSQIELVPGVKEANIAGVREREIRVELDLGKVSSYGIPLSLIMGRISAENSTFSAGNIEFAGNKIQIRVPGEYSVPVQIGDIMITMLEGAPVYVRDIAKVTDTYKDLSSVSRIDGEPCVSLNIKKRSGVNSVKLIEDVSGIVRRYRLPPDIKITEVLNEADYIDSMVKELENNIASGFILVIAVLLMFMGGRNSFFVAMAIPMSMLITFMILLLMGKTLNMIVLFALVLGVGMLVDNAIVIVENIYRNRCLGLSRVEASRVGASEVAWPVITSTLTTLVAFAPLMFWPDIMGQFMGFLPRTLIITLAASLFVGLVINPAVCSYFVSGGAAAGDRHEKGEHPFLKRYEAFLRISLANSGKVTVIGFLFLVISIISFALFSRGKELFPTIDPRNCQVNIKFPQGTSIERTDSALASVEQVVLGSSNGYEDVKFVLTTVGSGGPAMGFPGQGGSINSGSVHLEFKEWHDRVGGSTSNIIARIRRDVRKMAGAEVDIKKEEPGPPTGAPISIELVGDDFIMLSEYSTRIIEAIKDVPGVVDLTSDFEEALPEIRVRVNRHKAAVAGLDTASVGLFLRTTIYGMEASKFRADEDEHEITMRLPQGQRNSVNLLKQAFIPVGDGSPPVPLSSIAEFDYVGGLGTITRKNQKRLVTITGNDQDRPIKDILSDVEARLKNIELRKGYYIRFGGENEEMDKASAFLGNAFIFALAFIAVILVVQFNSALLPLIIMFTVLLSLVGVLWGLILCRLRFGIIMTGVGVISLAGVVVNNAIVLIDCIRQRKQDGLEPLEAIVAAGKLRIRPVLLTAVTTILGMIPMAVGYSLEVHSFPPRIISGAESSAWWAPMAVAVIFGLAFATVLTLLLVPSMVSLADKVAGWFRDKFPDLEG